jgi:hypothetical protein
MTAKIRCKELDLLKRAAASAILEAKRIRETSQFTKMLSCAVRDTEGFTLSLSIFSPDMMAAPAPLATNLS